MQQLSPLDALFLSVETDETPSHMGSLVVLDPGASTGFGFEAFRELVERRLSLCPRFKWMVREVPFGLDQPYWMGDPQFDLDRHIRRVRVPSPGGPEELARLAGALFQGRLDRDKPLWEVHFIEGLPRGRAALLWRVHHSLMDGLAGAGLTERLFDFSPRPEPGSGEASLEQVPPGAPPHALAWGTRALRNAAERPAALWRHGSGFASRWFDDARRSRSLTPEAAPRTPVNGVVGRDRSVAWTTVSFERVRALKSRLGVTVNDVVLALTAEAVRRYLAERDALPAASLVASVPVSTRVSGDESLGNQLTEMNVEWGTDIEDPVQRILAIHRSANQAKRTARSGDASLLHLLAETLTPGALAPIVRVASRLAQRMPLPANAVVSNVPLSPLAMFVAGARVESFVPISVLPPTQGLNITVVTYCGEMYFGITADPGLVANGWELADGIPKALVLFEQEAQRPIGSTTLAELDLASCA